MMQVNGTRDATGARQATSDSTGMNGSAAEGSARPRGKLGAVLEALEAGTGASLAELAALIGWQPQTVRAALSKLRRRGFAVRVAQPSDTAPSRRVGVSRFFVRLEIRPSSDFRADTAQPAAPTQQLTFVKTNRIVGVIVGGRDYLTWIRFSSGAVIKICDQRTAAARQWDMPSVSPRWAEGLPPDGRSWPIWSIGLPVGGPTTGSWDPRGWTDGTGGDTPLGSAAHDHKPVLSESHAASWQPMPPRRWPEITIRLEPRPTAWATGRRPTIARLE